MFGGLKNTAPKVPSSLPSGNPQGSKISLDKGNTIQVSRTWNGLAVVWK